MECFVPLTLFIYILQSVCINISKLYIHQKRTHFNLIFLKQIVFNLTWYIYVYLKIV